MTNGGGQLRGHILLTARKLEKSGMSRKAFSKYMKMLAKTIICGARN